MDGLKRKTCLTCLTRAAWPALTVVALLTLGGSLGGCVKGSEEGVKASAGALKEQDYDQTIILANQALAENPTGPLAAEAYYMRGRGYELRPVTSQAQLQANLQAARSSYVEAMKRSPSKRLSTYISASLGKVAFYQDDFATAATQLKIAYDGLDDKDQKAAALYLLGKSKQRFGYFVQADLTFNMLIAEYAASPWAQKAKETRGTRSFYLQLAVFKNPASADAASKTVRQRGLPPVRLIDMQGRQLVRSGPFATYAQASQMRTKVLDAFPDATVIP